jgi:hypothetical protein
MDHHRPTILAATMGTLGAILLAGAACADPPAAATEPTKLKEGLSPTVQLLELMDTDKNGKVSKAEFMAFMEAEFDFADRNKDGELDPKELLRLQRSLTHPVKGPGR